MFFRTSDRGFTLIELLVVIAIIGIISAIVTVSLNSARQKARDSRRLADLQQITKALELYYVNKGDYPHINYAQSNDSGCGQNWCNLETELAPYIDELPRDPTASGTSFYAYDADSGDSYQTYGLLTAFEDSSNYGKSNSDGGHFQSDSCCFEIGPQIGYCASKYSGAGKNWWSNSSSNVCVGGN